MIFALSVASAYILTNIDGLFAYLALASTGRRAAATIGFLVAQVVVIGGAVLVGGGAAILAPADLGLLGIVPVALGFREVLKNRRRSEQPEEKKAPPASVIGALALFLALSTDTFVVMAAFFADTRPEMDRFLLSGALIAVAALLALGTVLNRLLKPTPKTEKFFERLAPLVMIAAGLYILMDTQTDGF